MRLLMTLSLCMVLVSCSEGDKQTNLNKPKILENIPREASKATRLGQVEVLEFLHGKGYDVLNVTNDDGKTPLDLARKFSKVRDFLERIDSMCGCQ